MNPLAELKRKLAPRSRWGAITLGPRREFGSLTWMDAEERRQPQDGALVNSSYVMDEPEVTPLPSKRELTSVTQSLDSSLRKAATALLR